MNLCYFECFYLCYLYVFLHVLNCWSHIIHHSLCLCSQNLLDRRAIILDKWDEAEHLSHSFLLSYKLLRSSSVEQYQQQVGQSDSGKGAKLQPLSDSGRGASVVESFDEPPNSRVKSLCQRIEHVRSRKTKLDVHDLCKEYVSGDSCQQKHW